MRFAALLPILLLSGGVPASQDEAAVESAAKEDGLSFSRMKVEKAWSTLWPSERRDVIEWLRFELSVQDTFQRKLLRYVLERQPQDAGLWPLSEPAPIFDPETHAPRQPIARTRLAPDSNQAAQARRKFEVELEDEELERAWFYDWGRGGIFRNEEDDPTERLFRNAMRGYPPELDLVCALVALELDGGDERVALSAFGHAYSDRSGRVFPGVTLYDVWGSGKTFETPDIETLGIVHDVLGNWSKWKAPVSSSKQRSLYDTVGELYRNASRYRGLREALVDLYAMSRPRNRYGYENNRNRLHALWEHAASEPETLAPLLPNAKKWKSFLTKWDKTCKKDEELEAIAVNREWTLGQDEERVRRTLVWVLREYGALERKRRPAKDPALKSKSSKSSAR